MNKIVIIVFLIAVVLIAGVFFKGDGKESDTVNSAVQDGVSLVGAQEFSNLIQDTNAFLLDVHIPQQTHIPGTDAFIPFNDINGNTDKLPENKNTPILVYCRSGSMSKTAAQDIRGLGYTNVYDLDGGTNAFKGINDGVSIYPKNQDLETVIYGDVPTTTFTLTNYTNKPLEITRVSTSCGCTSAEVENTKLDSYDSTVVNVSFNPAVHGDDTDLGELTRTIYIDTDSPDFSQITSTITAKVIKN